MTFGKRVSGVKKRSTSFAEQSIETGEEALTALAERLGIHKPVPASGAHDDAFAFIYGLLLGALISGVVAVALAPTDGRTLRARIRRQIDDLLGRTTIEETEDALAGSAMSGANAVSSLNVEPVGASA